MDYLRRCWAEISLENIKFNLTQYKKYLPQGTEVMCVVKANCYGHSDEEIVPMLESEMGVKWFAVSNLIEGEKLRNMGIKGEILILGYTPPENADDLIKYNIIQACTEVSYAKTLNERAMGKIRVHTAIDTGMTRIGLHGDIKSICDGLEEIAKLENISMEGIFTHFAVADECDEDNISYTRSQIEKICQVENEIKSRGVSLEQVHFLNSAGGIYYSDNRSTLARLGIILYGLYPNPAKPLPFEPKPVMELKAVVSQVKTIEKGEDVSYGRTFTAPKQIKLATVTAGYADGYPRALSNKGEVLIRGNRCKITGRVCMYQFMCDVSQLD
ncbi:MAG: alanine racemase, partial [Hominimerdicola sp.]